MESAIVKRSADVWIEESARPYNLSIQEVVDAGALRRFNIKHEAVENTIAKIMLALSGEDPDTILGAVSIVFVMMVWRFRLKIASVLQFAENFLSGGDKKPTCWALRQMLHDDYENIITRYESVKLSRAVNATAALNGTNIPEPTGKRYF